jgi:hypothetical protein
MPVVLGVAVEAFADHLAQFTAADSDALVFGTSTGRPLTGGSRTTMFARAALHYQHAADDAQRRIAERLNATALRQT